MNRKLIAYVLLALFSFPWDSAHAQSANSQKFYHLKCKRSFTTDTPAAVRTKILAEKSFCEFETRIYIDRTAASVQKHYYYMPVEVARGKNSAELVIESSREHLLTNVIPRYKYSSGTYPGCVIAKSEFNESGKYGFVGPSTSSSIYHFAQTSTRQIVWDYHVTLKCK